MNMYFQNVVRILLLLSAAFATARAWQKSHDGNVTVNHIQTNIIARDANDLICVVVRSLNILRAASQTPVPTLPSPTHHTSAVINA